MTSQLGKRGRYNNFNNFKNNIRPKSLHGQDHSSQKFKYNNGGQRDTSDHDNKNIKSPLAYASFLNETNFMNLLDSADSEHVTPDKNGAQLRVLNNCWPLLRSIITWTSTL